MPKGTYNVQVKVAPSTDADPAALEADVRLGKRLTTIAAIGSLTGDGGALQLKVLRDRDTISRYLTRLRVAHTSPDAPAVDVQAKLAGRWIRVVRNLSSMSQRLPAPAGLEVPAADRRRRDQHRRQGPRQGQAQGQHSYTAWVGFLSPNDDYPGWRVRVQGRLIARHMESVWDYPRPPRVEPSAARVVVELDGEVVADTRRSLRVLETSHPPVYYIPAADVRAERLRTSARRATWCEYKGEARYYDAGDRAAVAWSPACPAPATRPSAAGHAFYPGRGGPGDRRRRAGRGPAGRLSTAAGSPRR